jgi:hypothetical protein
MSVEVYHRETGKSENENEAKIHYVLTCIRYGVRSTEQTISLMDIIRYS